MKPVRIGPLAGLTVGLASISGCASTQLNWNTENLGRSTGDVEVHQALDNIARFLHSKYLPVPSQVVIAGGQIQTQYTVTPQFQYTYTRTVQDTSTTGTQGGFAAMLSKVPAAQFQIPFAGQWNQYWAVQTINDSSSLRKLTFLYTYAAFGYISSFDLAAFDKTSGGADPKDDTLYAEAYLRQHPGATTDLLKAELDRLHNLTKTDTSAEPDWPGKGPGVTLKAIDGEPQFVFLPSANPLCLRVYVSAHDVTTGSPGEGDPVSLSSLGYPNLWISSAAFRSGCLARFVELVHDAEGVTSAPSSTAAAAPAAPVILGVPAGTAQFTIPPAIKR